MSIAEIKAEAQHMPARDVQFLAAYFHHLARRRDPGYIAGLDAAAQAVDTGDKVALDELRRLDRELHSSGL
jgi:hypothetical protein